MLKIANHCHYHKKAAREYIEQVLEHTIETDIQLHIDDQNVQFCSTINQQKICTTQSFQDNKLLRRAAQKNQSLIKACNNKKMKLNAFSI